MLADLPICDCDFAIVINKLLPSARIRIFRDIVQWIGETEDNQN